MISLCHDWGWQPPQIASCTQIRHANSVSAHWYAVHGYTVATLYSYPPNLAQIWGLWVTYVESKWCHYIMVKADRQLKLFPVSMLDIYKVFEHIEMLPIGIWQQPYTIMSTLLGSDFGVCGNLQSQMMSLCHGWGWQPPQTASPIHIRHIQSVWKLWYAVHGYTDIALHSNTHSTRLRGWGPGSLLETKCCHYVMVEADSYLKPFPASMFDVNKVFEHIDMLSMGIQ